MENQFLGDYQLIRCLDESSFTKTWLANQASVGRKVLLKQLLPSADRESFIADVRAKAGVEQPAVASIYEACIEDCHCYYAYELLPGDTLLEIAQRGETLRTQSLVHVLKRVAEANIFYESHGYATSPLDLSAIYVDHHGVVRIKNLVIHGSRTPEHSLRDSVYLGNSLQPMLDPSFPGAKRCLTLLAWMRGQDVEQALKWSQIRDYCIQIEQQLTTPTDLIPSSTAPVSSEKKSQFVWIISTLLFSLTAILIFFFQKKPMPSQEPFALASASWVNIPAGKYTAPDGLQIKVSPFKISSYEVTIGEYAAFLETLEILKSENGQTAFDHSEQPSTKQDHLPNDWQKLYPIAKARGLWNGQVINLNHPVTGIDWWDASAYATWKKSFIPTQEQWLSALISGTQAPHNLPVSNFLPVNEITEDRTSHDVLGLGGSVSEWTSEARINPSNPLGAPLWVIIGASYQNPSNSALAREWIEERSTRRTDLGFRIAQRAD